jgi:hypothetical protein
MSTLDDVRRAYPELDKYGYNDAEVVQWLAGKIGADTRSVAEYYGVADARQGDLSRGFSAAIDSTQGLAGGLVGMLGDAVGNQAMQDYGTRVYQRNMAEIDVNSRPTDRVEGINGVGDAVDFAQYWLGYGAEQITEALVTGGFGAAAGKTIARQGVKRAVATDVAERFPGLVGITAREAGETGAKRGALGAMAAQSVGVETGATYGMAAQDAIDAGSGRDDINLGRVAGFGAAAGALEFGADVATLGLGRLGVAGQAFDLLNTGRRRTNVPIRAATGALTEGTTEVLQTGLEEMGAGRSFGEANFSDPTSFFAGAIGGGAIGAVGGLRTPRAANPDPQTRLGDIADQAAADNQARIEEQQRVQQEQQAQRVAQGERRAEAAMGFISPQKFAAELDAARAEDVLDPTTEEGALYKSWKLENEIYPTTPQDDQKFAKQWLKENTDQTARKAEVEQQWKAALDAHIQYKDEAAARTPETSAEIETLKTELLGELNIAKKAKDREAIRLVEQTAANRLSPAEWNAAKWGAAKLLATPGTQAPQTPVAAQTPMAAAPAPTPVAKVPPAITPETPVRRRTDAQLKADALLPEGWTENAKYDEVNSALNGKNFKLKAFNDAMTKALAPEQAPTVAEAEVLPPESSEQTAPEILGDLATRGNAAAEAKLGKGWTEKHPDGARLLKSNKFASFNRWLGEQETTVEQAAPTKVDTGTDVVITAQAAAELFKGDNYSDNQRAVGEVLLNAFRNNQEDVVIQPDGTWNTTKIAELSGVKSKQAVTAAIKQIKPKIARSYNVTPGQLTARLAEKAKERRQVEAYDADAANTQFDATDLAEGKGFSTKASMNQGAYELTGSKGGTAMATAEDIAFTQQQTDAPDPVREKRAAEAAQKRKAFVADVIKRSGRAAVVRWDNLSAEGDVKFSQLSTEDQIDWVLSVDENLSGELSDEILSDDQRQIATRYDASNAGVTMEMLDEQDRAAESERTAIGRSENAVRDGEGRGAVEQGRAESARPLEGGAVQRDTKDVAQQISDANPVPKSLRNQTSFKESYAAKNGYSSGLWENPDLQNAARLADWLGALDQTQWDAINASFTNNDNPFKNPSFVDADATIAKFEAILDTGVRGGVEKAPVVETRKKKKVMKFGTGDAVTGTASREQLQQTIRDLTGKDDSRRIHIYENEAEAVAALEAGEAIGSAENLRGKMAYGWVAEAENGESHAHFILDRIPSGAERSAFMHEVGGHVGWEGIIDPDTTEIMVAKIGRWAEKQDGTLESDIARAAMARVTAARMNDAVNDETYNGEVLAYFLEEATNAGVQPTVKTAIGRLLRDLYAAFKKALHRLDLLRPELTAQDVVDIAWGAARMNLSANFHSSGSDFRRFDNRYVGSGEGNAAFGVGNYLAERLATTMIYPDRTDRGTTMKVDILADDTELLDWFAPARNNPRVMEFLDNLPEHISDALMEETNTDNLGNLTGRYVYLGLTGVQMRDYLIEEYVSPETYDYANTMTSNSKAAMAMVSGYLNENGIKGVIYADQLSRKADANAAETTNNRVIFDANNLVVVGRTDKAVAKQGEQTALQNMRFGVTVNAVEQRFGKKTADVYVDSANIFKKATDSIKFVPQIVRDVSKKMPAAKQWLNAMRRADEAKNQIKTLVDAIAVEARRLSDESRGRVNKFLKDSTSKQEWGYDPQWAHRKVKFDENSDMAKRFAALNADEQQIVKAVFQHGENMRLRMVEIAKANGVADDFFSASKLQGPYAPLKRFGNYAAILKSQELLDAEKEARENGTPANKAKVDKLYAQPEHYVVEFHDTLAQASRFVKDNGANYAEQLAVERRPNMYADRVTNTEMLEKVLASVKADSKSGLDPAAKKAFSDMLRQMYFEQLDERDARQSGARRRNVEGANKDMLRSFLSHATAQASFISRMEYGADINQAFRDMKDQAKGEDLSRTYAVLSRHYEDMMSYKATPIQDRIAAFNSTMMLTSSIGYHFTNMTQPIMVTIPRLAGDFNDYTGAWRSLTRAYKYSVAAAKMAKNLETNIDVESRAIPQKYHAILKHLQLQQLLDVGMDEDLSQFDRFNSGYMTLDKASDTAAKITHKLYQVSRWVEAQNRITSAIAAYDLATANPDALKRMDMTVEEYVTAAVEDTQGNFTRAAAPLAIKKLGPVITQYRKYQMLMIWAYANSFKTGFFGETPEVKAAGKRVLAYTLGHAALFGGLTGVPLATTIVPWFLAFANDGDEPEDLERFLKEKFDGKLGDVLSSGALSMLGIDMSGKLSQADIFDPLPYVDLDPSVAGMEDTLLGLIGPAGTTALNFGRAAGYLKQGDIYKAIEYSTPKGIRSAVESYRLYNEGYTTSSGQLLLDPRAFNVYSLLLNATGIPSTDIQNVKWTRGQQYELEQWFGGESSRIRKEYVEAARSRNNDDLNRLREEWRDLQDAKDRVRPFFNNSPNALRRQPVSDLMRAPQERARTEARNQAQLGAAIR